MFEPQGKLDKETLNDISFKVRCLTENLIREAGVPFTEGQQHSDEFVAVAKDVLELTRLDIEFYVP